MTTPNRFTREGFIQAQEVIAMAAEERPRSVSTPSRS